MAAKALSETIICNMALAKVGSKRINDFGDTSESTPEAIHCRTHYDQTRDALIRSHWWRFASARAVLSEDTESPAFEWDNQFVLPTDFMRMKSVYSDNNTARKNLLYSYALEGKLLLTNESEISIRYIKRVTDVTEFDPLFVEVLVLSLALKLVMPIAGGGRVGLLMYNELKKELTKELMPKVRALDRQETERIGRGDLRAWNDARYSLSGRIDSQLGS